ncbi:ABC transporter ATP-binding protein/permease [Brevundimonas sp. 3P9-tot-E]|uniref:ABCB family ABC transporter ATP-binding protein/permease n=1 Tax=Brevundimonas TaxID=41275 RepID=UPI001F1919AC|nr:MULTISPECIES: ABC transporter ATP-binding protein/permease [Brevundimonas]MDA0742223.1 ABC transporter ATP-binding protein/permease [Pseudomonadota bacterium]MDA1321598.1 ABC transporter ATP-binding protein/permease [Pseudomonadota bacterium]MDM8351382.1 ABC transporter ATP-binding protein/permease [Brevundimonas diminuta]
MNAGTDPAQQEAPPTLEALKNLIGVVARSGAPQLPWRVAGAILLTLAGKGLGVLAPLVLGAAVNHLAADQGPAASVGLGFAAFAVGWALVRFLSAATPQLSDVVFAPVRAAAQRKTAAETFAHALSLSLDFHQTKRSGALSRVMERGSRAVDFLLRILMFNLGPTVLELVLAAAVLGGKYDWRFGVVAVGVVLVYAVTTFAMANWRLEHRRAMNAADSEAAGLSVDALLNYETVKSFGAEGRAAQAYEASLATYAKASLKANTSLATLNLIQGLIMNVGLGVMAVMAGFEAAAGRMGPGDVTAAVLIMISLYAPLNILGFAYREIRQSFIDMEEMLKVTRQAPQVADAPDAIDLPRPESGRGAEVVFDHVGFRHDARAAGLDDVSFVTSAGTTTALVGPSGAGKSTIVKLALRLLDPQEGAVLIDGRDARSVTQASLRAAVALVPQDVALFNDTIAANIAFARPDADEAAIWAAAEAAELADFIRNLPEGMDTRVGERGLKLSGGERQRVGIARALLADPCILILDEATSALDSRTEAAIQKTLRKARTGRTTLVVAHRLSTVADADQILVLKAGRIVERGAHHELVARQGGEYAALWRKQTRGAKTPIAEI